jgi:hypothetical protein
MVQALFAFDTNGHRTQIEIETGEVKSRGPLPYPASALWDPDRKVPSREKYDFPER